MRVKTKFIFALILSSFLFEVNAQNLDQTISRIHSYSNDSSTVMELTDYLTNIYGPRLSGSKSYLDGAEWVVYHVKNWGVANAELGKFGTPIVGWELRKQSFEMISPRYVPLNTFPLAWTKGTDGKKVSNGIYIPRIESIESLKQHYAGKLTNKVVFLRNHDFVSEPQFSPAATRYTSKDLETKSENRKPRPLPPPEVMAQFFEQIKDSTRQIFNFFEQEGANALVLPSSRPHGIIRVEGTYLSTKDDLRALPTIVMGNEDFGRIIRMIEKNIAPEFAFELATEFSYDPERNVNVMIEIPGADEELKNETIMIGAHFDTWHAGTGAADNSANCAVLLEVVRTLKKLDIQLHRTLVIGLWGGEEPGVYGSRGYVEKHLTADGKLNEKGDNLLIYLNLDKGIGKIRGIELQQNEQAREPFEKIFRTILGDEFAVSIENAIGSDHMVFDLYGIPSFQLLQDPINYHSITHHTSMDTFEYVIESDLKHNVATIASMIYLIDALNITIPHKKPE